MIQSQGFEAARDVAMRRIVRFAWGVTPAAPLAAWLAGNGVVPVLLLAVAFAACGTMGVRFGGAQGRTAAALALVGQAVAITAALAGHPWQLDSHILFFAFLAMTLPMSDPRAVLVAAGTIAAHHLALSVVMPALVYPSADLVENVQRTLLHGAAVAVETTALLWAIATRNRMDAEAVIREERLTAAERRDRGRPRPRRSLPRRDRDRAGRGQVRDPRRRGEPPHRRGRRPQGTRGRPHGP